MCRSRLNSKIISQTSTSRDKVQEFHCVHCACVVFHCSDFQITKRHRTDGNEMATAISILYVCLCWKYSVRSQRAKISTKLSVFLQAVQSAAGCVLISINSVQGNLLPCVIFEQAFIRYVIHSISLVFERLTHTAILQLEKQQSDRCAMAKFRVTKS